MASAKSRIVRTKGSLHAEYIEVGQNKDVVRASAKITLLNEDVGLALKCVALLSTPVSNTSKKCTKVCAIVAFLSLFLLS